MKSYSEIVSSCLLTMCVNELGGEFVEYWEDKHFRYVCLWLTRNERGLPSTIKREILNNDN